MNVRIIYAYRFYCLLTVAWSAAGTKNNFTGYVCTSFHIEAHL